MPKFRAAVMAAIVASLPMIGLMAQASTHPSFAGTWVLDVAKSDPGPMTPASASYTIVQRGDTLITDRESTQPGADTPTKSHLVVGVDGKAWKNMLPVAGESLEATSTVTWDKDAMVMHTSGTIQGTDVDQLDRWTLSPDGKTLLIHRSVSVGGAEQASGNLVFNRKP